MDEQQRTPIRKRIFEIIEVAQDGDRLSDLYDSFMLIAILISIIPLAFKNSNRVFEIIGIVTAVIFIVDYILRWMTADYKLKKRSVTSFIKYPFTPWAIIDLVSILPSLTTINSGLKLLRLFRLARTLRVFRALRVFRVFKAMRYSKSFDIIFGVIRKSKDALIAVMVLAIGYVVISALIVFNVEPDSFNSFFDAVYWATVSLTTVGYGDIYPVSVVGRIVTMVSSVFGIAIVALPAGIITAGYMSVISENKKKDDGDEEEAREETREAE